MADSPTNVSASGLMLDDLVPVLLTRLADLLKLPSTEARVEHIGVVNMALVISIRNGKWK